MRRPIHQAFWAAFFAQALVPSAASGAGAPPPVEAFSSLPQIADVHLSPDGTHFSAIEPYGGRPAVLVFQLHPPPGTKPQVFSLEESNATGSYWVNNDRLICFFYRTKFFGGHTEHNLGQLTRNVSVSLSGKTKPFMLMEGTQVYDDNFGSALWIAGRNDTEPGIVYMEASKRHGPKFEMTMFAVNVDDNHIEELEAGNVDTTGWWLDEHGRAVARIDATASYETPKSLDTFFVKDGDAWRKAAAYENSAGSVAEMQGLTIDGSAMAVLRHTGDDKAYLETLPLKAGAAPAVLYKNPGYDSAALIDEWAGRVVGAVYSDDRRRAVYFDPVLARTQKRLEAALPGQTVELSSWNKDRSVYLVTAQDPRDPPGIYLFTAADSHLEYLMNAYPSLQPADLADMEPYPYKARDGLDLHAYLTLPPGRTPKNLPTVIFPHGGPDARDEIGFDWWAQFMASRGYAVLQPNFRGSTGYGARFRSAGYGQWGRKMQEDISDGVKKLIADGIADPKRICIVGASYGGYAALAGATFTPDLYACAV
ncbi:MAG TPA: prolyl oligopeptidase family serine peptidase, partial [Rhizomicrobium sp.]|nr:prolyl oligopeptidase family serine peptidase [Rhizomicrobium sp.]